MRHAMLVLILALANGPEPSPVADSPLSGDAHAITARSGTSIGGVWVGEWAGTGAGVPVPLQASLTMGAAKNIFGYFTFTERGVRRTVLRQGVAAPDGLRFVWLGGRSLQLRLTGADRLEGQMLAPSIDGAAPAAMGSVSLSRWQP